MKETSSHKLDTNDKFDAIIVGAGHAGCEAAAACAFRGLKTLLLTINLDTIGALSCNPAIGGLAKGHMVKEIDALGGMMGVWADAAGIQFRVLNTSKGPAVRSSRAQMDRDVYKKVVQEYLFSLDNLLIFQDTVEELLIENNCIKGVKTAYGMKYLSDNVLLTTGTFLQGLLHVGLKSFSGGRMGDPASFGISEQLKKLGFEIGRLKTGTTPRILNESIDFSKMEKQDGDNPPHGFSFRTKDIPLKQLPCYMTWTNEKTHDIIRNSLDRSPLYSGIIKGTGARYCPSIEDKIARFPDKERHQVFIEPEGLSSVEYYPNGISTSLPFDVQKDFVRSIVGLENAQILRPGYAIEYDFIPPTQLTASLETKIIQGLYCAGQINGTSGYEEAAAQGLYAALNIIAKHCKLPAFHLKRNEAYIAVLVDDLITKGTAEPYRMFTSRAEHRLLLREGNADLRLTEKGHEFGLIKNEQWKTFQEKRTETETIVSILQETYIKPTPTVVEKLTSIGGVAPGKSVNLAALLRQPDLSLEALSVLWPETAPALASFQAAAKEEAQTQICYEGYIKRQEELVLKSNFIENKIIPADIDYTQIASLSAEVVEKLKNIRPSTLGQASRISGITPAALMCVEIHIKKLAKIPLINA